jgi:E3 ubiquitin-protein ligase HECTD1
LNTFNDSENLPPPLLDIADDLPASNKNRETLTELSNQVWQVLLSQIESSDDVNSGQAKTNTNAKNISAKKYSTKSAKETDDPINNNKTLADIKESSAITLSTILQRCQSSLDGALAQQIDAAMLQEMEDEEEDEELMRDTIPNNDENENETDENIDDEFLEEDFVNNSSTTTQNVEKVNSTEFSSNSLALETGIQHMRELKRRHGSHAQSSAHQRYQVTAHTHRQQNESEATPNVAQQSAQLDNNNNKDNNNNSSGVSDNFPMNNPYHHDEFVLKCQFSALIPAFDPRPGKNNINQIQDISVPPTSPNPQSPVNTKYADLSMPAAAASLEFKQPKQPKVDLFLRVQTQNCDLFTQNHHSQFDNGLEFIKSEIKLTNKNATIFQYIQSLIELNPNNDNTSPNTLHYEKMKNVWDMNYSLIYRESDDSSDLDEISSLPLALDDSPQMPNQYLDNTNGNCNVEQVLKLLTILRRIIQEKTSTSHASSNPSPKEIVETTFEKVYKKEFISEKINNKLIQQLQDPLVLASRSLPEWCRSLLHSYKFLFPFETRQLYFTTTAFGVSRSIVWLQNKRDTLLTTLRGPVSQRVMRDDHEFRIGRLKHERIKIPREPTSNLLKSAMNTLKFHATRKAILEIEFVEEEGTGLGPTLEFFSLIAGELQRKKFALWHCDDGLQENEADSYVHHLSGLFPGAYPSPPLVDNKKYWAHYQSVIEFFNFIGIFLAKSLQDQRLVDIPFSYPFLKLICGFSESKDKKKMDSNDLLNFINDKFDLNDILNLDDLVLVDPGRGNLLKQLKSILKTHKQGDEFFLIINNDKIKLEDLGLVFEYNPPSKVFGYQSYNLKPNGADINVTEENVEEYVDLMIDFVFKTGIEPQLQAFKDGFDSVFSMDSLKCFEPNELQLLLSGDQAPTWTCDEVMNYTEPKLGYTKESPGFLRFVNVMCEMNPEERKSFVQFLTGCSSLPPGGLANLHPRLTVVKKDGNDFNYPSVNTCVHYLKLPEYSSEEILKKQLSIACQEKGFYLN